MTTAVSILMPCRDNLCTALAEALAAQAEALAAEGRLAGYEIIVADDGSTDASVMALNRRINALPNSRYIERGFNVGRAAIRNFLARAARYDRLIFIDSDMTLRNPMFIAAYLACDDSPVVYGGYTVESRTGADRRNLQYAYERKFCINNTMQKRKADPYNHFRTHNFMVSRAVMLAHPFDETMRKYGYEDVAWSDALRRAGITITHISNPISIDTFETNAAFTAKTEEGLATLYDHRAELAPYSSLIKLTNTLVRLHAAPIVRLFFAAFASPVRRNITGRNPSVLLFNLYKLGKFCTMFCDNK